VAAALRFIGHARDVTAALLVHGIWDTGKKLDVLARALEAGGVPRVHRVDLLPNDGSASIPDLARLVERAAEGMGEARIDVVGFSMGALVSRYFIQRMSGRQRVRRFVSIAGPHAGTALARFLPGEGVRDMRRASALVRELASDPDPWGDVEVHTIWTPYDLMIRPTSSSQLAKSKSDTRIPAVLHRLLITDRRSLSRVTEILTAP
jgi:triacylglycerol lipase